LFDVQRQFVDIDTSQQHRLTNLLSTIQRHVPPQPSQSYKRLAAKSYSDTDDGIYLTSSNRARISSSTACDDEDDSDDESWWVKNYHSTGSSVSCDGNPAELVCSTKQPLSCIKQEPAKREADINDSDDDDWWETNYHSMGSSVSCDGVPHEPSCSAKQPLPCIKQEPVEHYADMDIMISDDDEEEMVSFAASFDSQADAGASSDMGRHNSLRADGGSSSKCFDDSDDGLTAATWQRLHGNPGACKLKVEDVDDVSDVIAEFVNEPAAQPATQPAETAGNIYSSMLCGLCVCVCLCRS